MREELEDESSPDEDAGSDSNEEIYRRNRLKEAIKAEISHQETAIDEDNKLVAFKLDDKVVYRVPKSLDCFTADNRFRRFLLRVVETDRFNNAIMVVIVLNAINIAAYSSSPAHKDYNAVLEYFSYAFTAIYVFEAIAKIIASGFLLGKNTYLRDPTNIFDFIIVWISIMQVFFSLFLSKATNVIFVFRVLKIFRVARLLSSFYKIPQMRQ